MTKTLNIWKKKALRRLSKNKRGQTLVEYALILAFISIVAIAVLQLLGGQVSNVFGHINTKLAEATSGS